MDEEEEDAMGWAEKRNREEEEVVGSALSRFQAKIQLKCAALPAEGQKLEFEEACRLLDNICKESRISFSLTVHEAGTFRFFRERLTPLFASFLDYSKGTLGASPLNSELLRPILCIATCPRALLPETPATCTDRPDVSPIVSLAERLRNDQPEEDFLLMYQVPFTWNICCERGSPALAGENDSNTVLQAICKLTKGGNVMLDMEDLCEELNGDDELVEQVRHVYAQK